MTNKNTMNSNKMCLFLNLLLKTDKSVLENGNI